VLVPGLAARFPGLADDAWPAAPALSRWLSRARRGALPAGGLERSSLALFEVGASNDALPVAPFAYLGDTGRSPPGYCWCADLVHLRADTQGLILFEAATCRVSPEERRALFVLLREFLIECGWQLEEGDPLRWYLRGPGAGDLQTTPLSEVRGQSVAGYLPRGKGAAAWLKRSNEVQMLLHSHPVNRARADRGLPVLNSLWISGGGRLPAPRQTPFTRILGDSPLLRGLGLWSGAATAGLPQDPGTLLAGLQPTDRALLLLDGLELPAGYGDLREWLRVVEEYERSWLEPLLQALSRGGLRRLSLVPGNGQRYRLTRAALWRPWRRSRPWHIHMSGDRVSVNRP
jgi:hypothetical protein